MCVVQSLHMAAANATFVCAICLNACLHNHTTTPQQVRINPNGHFADGSHRPPNFIEQWKRLVRE